MEEGDRARVLQDGADCPLIVFAAIPFRLASVQLKQSCQEAGIHRRERVGKEQCRVSKANPYPSFAPSAVFPGYGSGR